MNTITLIKTSLNALRKHKGRSLLTIMSIIVGIAALICTLAIGYGAEAKIRRKIEAMGKNYIFIHAGNWRAQGKTKASKKKRTTSLTMKDIALIKMQVDGIAHIAPAAYAGQQIVKYGGSGILTKVNGEAENILKITRRSIGRGTFFTRSHIENTSRVVTLGFKAARELFGYSNPLEKSVTIGKTPFKVIGVLQEVKNFMGQQDPNMTVYIPISTMKKIIQKRYDENISAIVVGASSSHMMPHVVRNIRKLLRYKHKLKKHDTDDFTIYDQKSMTKAAEESSGVLTLFLLIIASISLLVGGIGVMNIMLVSVTERTKEIGIRMALGANAKMIRRQFILEAITLCTMGGFFGTILGVALPYGASYFTGWIVIHKLHVIVLAVFITMLIGVFFGFYPAFKASRLNPVEALTDR